MLTLKCQQEALSTATALLNDEYPPYIGIKGLKWRHVVLAFQPDL